MICFTSTYLGNSKVQSVAPSGECLRGEGLVWLIGGGGVLAIAATAGPIVR